MPFKSTGLVQRFRGRYPGIYSPSQISRTKERFTSQVVSGLQRPSRVTCLHQFWDGDTLSSERGQQDWNWTCSSDVRVATSAVRREAEREEGQSQGPDPSLFLDCCGATNCINTTRHSVASCVGPANAGENSRRGKTNAVGGLRRRGQNGQAATPAAHVQTREHFGTQPKEQDSSKNVNKNSEDPLWGLKNTDPKINNSN